jgi:hypothetical protein
MRDAELWNWSNDAALALTILVRGRSGDIPNLRLSGTMCMALFCPPVPRASHSASFVTVDLDIGTLVKTDGDPSLRGGGLGSNEGDLR